MDNISSQTFCTYKNVEGKTVGTLDNFCAVNTAKIIAKIDEFNAKKKLLNPAVFKSKDSIIFQYQTKNKCGVGSDADFSNKIMFKKQQCIDDNGDVVPTCTELVKVDKVFPMCPTPSISKKALSGKLSEKLLTPQIINRWEKPYVMKYPVAIEYRTADTDLHCVEF